MTTDNLRASVIDDLCESPGLPDDLSAEAILSGAFPTAVSTGRARGAVEATRQALSSLAGVAEATHILYSICGGEGITMDDVNAASDAVVEAAHADANITFASMIDSDLADEFQVTMIAGSL